MSLCVSRKTGERIVIAGEITVRVKKIRGGSVVLEVDAPADIPVNREEIELKKQAQTAAAKSQVPA